MSITDSVSPSPFEQWFGSSKVVDEFGKPVVMYHAATADFGRFRRATHDLGFHFGTAGQAEDRFQIKLHEDPYGAALKGVQWCTMPVFLSISRPLRMRDLGDWRRDNMVANLPDEFTLEERLAARTCAQIRDLIVGHGYDGIVYANEMEAKGAHALRLAKFAAFHDFYQVTSGNVREEDCKGLPAYLAYQEATAKLVEYLKSNCADSWLAFEPTQVKSAIGNAGAYNRKDADITDAKARAKAALHARHIVAAESARGVRKTVSSVAWR